MSVKRAHKTLSILEKLKVIEDSKKGLTGKQLAKKYGVGEATICDIKKQSGRFKRWVNHM